MGRQDASGAEDERPVGFAVPGWSARPLPPDTPMGGRWCRVEALDVRRHADQLYEASADDPTGRNWTYLFDEMPPGLEEYRGWLRRVTATRDPFFHVIVDRAFGSAVGVAAYMSIDTTHGVIEVGHINYSPRLQRTVAATEAMYLMMRRVFDELGYRRYEWKCDDLNAPSHAAAKRLGFLFEGVFRQAVVYKGRNRDTAWYSITDREWPAVRREFERWLSPENFDGEGRQKTRLDMSAVRAV